MAYWLQSITPYVDEWTTAATRIYLVPSAAPDQIEAPLTSDMYPTASVVGTRHHAVNALVLIC